MFAVLGTVLFTIVEIRESLQAEAFLTNDTFNYDQGSILYDDKGFAAFASSNISIRSGKSTSRFPCEPKRYTDRCIKYFHFERIREADFFSARIACEEMGMELVSIENQGKWGDLVVAIRAIGVQHYWTSAVRNHMTGKFEWGNGCPVNFAKWQPGEPNNHYKGGEDCIEIYPNYRWNDYPCVGLKPKFYICESRKCQEAFWVQH